MTIAKDNDFYRQIVVPTSRLLLSFLYPDRDKIFILAKRLKDEAERLQGELSSDDEILNSLEK